MLPPFPSHTEADTMCHALLVVLKVMLEMLPTVKIASARMSAKKTAALGMKIYMFPV